MGVDIIVSIVIIYPANKTVGYLLLSIYKAKIQINQGEEAS